MVTAYSDRGVRTAELRYWTVDTPHEPAQIWPELALGWNVSSRWHTALLASWIGQRGQATRLDNLVWQNDWLLTQGEWPIDLALHTLWVKPQQQGGHLIEFGPALQTDIGRTQLNLNLVFERGFGERAARPTQLKYQWQVRHRWRPALHVGLVGFGELGPWRDWYDERRSQRGGPALFGQLPAGEGRTLHWEVAWLVGRTYRQHGSMFSGRLFVAF